MITLPSLQICCVKPVPYQDESLLPMEGYERPEKIRKFHMVNNIDKFQYDRPYHKGNKDRDNEFKVRAQWSQIEIKVAFEFSYTFIYYYRGVFRTFELRVLTVIDCPKIAGAKGR